MKKMKGKRLLSLLMTLCMVLSLVPVTAFASSKSIEIDATKGTSGEELYNTFLEWFDQEASSDTKFVITDGASYVKELNYTLGVVTPLKVESPTSEVGEYDVTVTWKKNEGKWYSPKWVSQDEIAFKFEVVDRTELTLTLKDGETLTWYGQKVMPKDIFKLVFDKAEDTDGGNVDVDADEVVVEYAAYNFPIGDDSYSVWTEIDAEMDADAFKKSVEEEYGELVALGLGYILDGLAQYHHAFGTADTENIRITRPQDSEYYESSATTTINLEDNRAVTEIYFENNGIEFEYGNFDENDLLDELMPTVIALPEGTALDAVVSIKQDVTNLNAGDAVEVTMVFDGDEEHKPSKASTEIKITKAPATVTVESVVVQYNEDYDLDILVNGDNKIPVITVIAGLDMANMQVVNGEVTFPETVVNVDFSDVLSDIIPGFDLSSLLPKESVSLTKALEILANLDFGSEYVADEYVDQLISYLRELENKFGEVNVTFSDETPEDIGVYLVGAVAVDPNYETAMGVGSLVITPDGHRADLAWNVPDDNGVMALTRDITLDTLGARVAALEGVERNAENEAECAEADKEIELLFIGMNIDGEIVLTQDLTQENKLTGAYAEVACIVNWGNDMYYSEPIARTLIFAPELVDVRFVDANENNARIFPYTGNPCEMEVLVDDSDDYDRDDLRVFYTGVTVDGEVYNSEVAPSKVGAYTATALYAEKEDGEIVKAGMAIGAMVIEKQDSDFAMYGGTKTWTGEEQFVEVYNPKGVDDILYVIVNEDPNTEATNVNVIIPEALKVMVPELGDKESLSTIPAKEAITKLIAKVENAKMPEGLVMPEGFVTELNKALGEVKDVLVKVPNATVTINGDKPVDCGTYNVYAVTFSRNVKSDYAEAVLTIDHAYNTAWESDATGHWHKAICGCGVVTATAAHTASGWIVDTEATATTAGSKHTECTVCEYVMETATIPATGSGRPSGGGGGGGSTKYAITVEDTTNGTLELSHKNASKGTTVTITAVPEAGYETGKVVVTTAKGETIEVKDLGNGKYTFKMPSSKVTVDAEFVVTSGEVVGEQEVIILTIDSVIAWVFDQYVTNDVAPVIRNARTMLPARFVAEALGGVVTWDEAQQKVTIVKGETTIEIFIGEPFAVVNGTPVELDCPAFIENSRTYLPIRFIAENLGATVTWDGAAQTVTIVPGN